MVRRNHTIAIILLSFVVLLAVALLLFIWYFRIRDPRPPSLKSGSSWSSGSGGETQPPDDVESGEGGGPRHTPGNGGGPRSQDRGGGPRHNPGNGGGPRPQDQGGGLRHNPGNGGGPRPQDAGGGPRVRDGGGPRATGGGGPHVRGGGGPQPRSGNGGPHVRR